MPSAWPGGQLFASPVLPDSPSWMSLWEPKIAQRFRGKEVH